MPPLSYALLAGGHSSARLVEDDAPPLQRFLDRQENDAEEWATTLLLRVTLVRRPEGVVRFLART